MCLEINLYLSNVEAIINDLETKLVGAYHLYVGQKGKIKTTTENTALDSELLNFLEEKAYKPGIYEDIGKKLDKHFYSLPEPL